jgi:uracil permease
MNLILPAVEKDDEVEDLDEDLNLEPELRYEAN